jgi:hypothetical protein
MENPLKERDWKYLRRIRDEMLHKLCSDINRRAAEIAGRSGGNPHEQYLELYRFLRDSDRTVGDCFNDWRRSQLSGMIIQLRQHGLLTDQHVQGLSPTAQEWLREIDRILKR